MRESHLLVARSQTLDQHAPGGASAFTDLILEAWPRSDSRPDLVEAMTVVELCDLLSAEPQPKLAGGLPRIDLRASTPVVLVCWHGSEPMGRVAELADHLLRLRIPSVFSVQRCDDTWRRFECAGLLVEPMDAKPRHLAAMLLAMSSQAGVIEDMRRELRAAKVSQGGISGQMNRIHEELNLASAIQRDLMPASPPEIEGLEMGVIFRPAAYVSGDVFDLRKLEDGRLAFLLADAVGHGVPAALLTMLIHRAVTEARLPSPDEAGPAETIRAINAALAAACPGSSSNRFATAVFGLYDPDTHEVSISVAGHPPPFRLRQGGQDRISAHGPLLGVFDDAQFDEETFVLEPGETLLLYSDGFEVAFPEPGAATPANELYLQHFERFGASVARHDGLVSGLRDLEATLDTQQGSLNQNDDITAIALRRPRQAEDRVRAA